MTKKSLLVALGLLAVLLWEFRRRRKLLLAWWAAQAKPPASPFAPTIPALQSRLSQQEDFVVSLFRACQEAEATTPHGLGTILLSPKRQTILVTNPEHAFKILRTSARHMQGGALGEATKSFIGPNSLFALEGAAWKYERLKVKAVLMHALSKDNRPKADQVVMKMIAKLKLDVKHSGQLKVDMHAVFLRLHFAVVGTLLLEEDFGFFGKAAATGGEAMIGAFEYLVQTMPQISAKPELMRTKEWANKSEEARSACRAAVKQKLATRSSATLNQVFDLLGGTSEAGEFALIEEVTDCILQFFLAGFNTVAVELSFCLFYLCQNPVWWNAVRVEVDEALSGGSGLVGPGKLPLLNAIRMETLRLVPPAAFTTRVLESDLALSGGEVVLPQGADVLIPIVYLHASQASWGANAREFSPKRWSSASPLPGSFLPFSAGMRNCVGEDLAQLESITALAMLVHYFSFQLVPGSRQIPKWTGYGIRPFDSSGEGGEIAMNLLLGKRVKPRQVEYTMRKITPPVPT